MTITAEKDDPRLARQVALLRVSAGWRSQKAASDATGINRDLWNKLEKHGTMPPSPFSKVRFAEALGICRDAFFRYEAGEIDDLEKCFHT